MTPVVRTRFVILTVAAAVVLFFLRLFGAFGDAEAWLMRSLSGVEARLASTALSLRQSVSAPFRLAVILEEDRRLREREAGLLTEIAGLRALEDENAELRRLLGFAEREPKPPVLARVIARTPSAGSHSIVIDRGSDDGLRAEMPVVAGGGVIVGKIFKVERSTAVALLLTDTRSRIGASIQDADRTQGVVQGDRGLSLEMRLIPQNEEISTGDLVVTSGIEPLTPRGLVIGRVEEVRTQEKNPFKQATIVPAAPYDRLEIVAVPVR